ncbi:Crp/Fnr family transcriptional regulator [Roseateles violae]|uniref:Cyclic nucleotide-binding domain-containing protein n=1 Tax=Roseateles violae TaxID=3058042 RepID=A0ABT8DXV6_9BURK|nr:cyclic nucleotide-binding domain-containing protein [Pelomonas sp. PFR6]MDN3922470.1 cyclic nucleotide-binding domain-containing protein [Pelomonas sp. PFR6]
MELAEIARQGGSALQAWAGMALGSPTQIFAHLAATLALLLMMLGALMRTMLPLRWLAVGGNLGLALYGALHPAPLTLAIAAVLLPANLYRALEVTRLTRRVSRAAADANLAGLWLRPYMKSRRLRAGQTLFRKGDRADWLYLLLDGEMELSDIGQPLQRGRIFGEIALFSPDRMRTHTARCVSACTVLQIHASTVKQLYYQNPAFGMHLIELLCERLGSDVARAERQQAQA